MARAAELTTDPESAKGEDKPLEAKSLRPGRAARAVVYDGRAVRDAIEAVLAAPEESREVAQRAYKAVRDRLVAGQLDTMPVDRLRDLIRGKVTFAPLIDAGLETVGQVLAAGAEALGRIPRVRRRTGRRIMAAASQMRESVEDSTRVRIDPDARSPEQTALIAALRRYERARSALKGPDLSPLATEIGRRFKTARLIGVPIATASARRVAEMLRNGEADAYSNLTHLLSLAQADLPDWWARVFNGRQFCETAGGVTTAGDPLWVAILTVVTG